MRCTVIVPAAASCQNQNIICQLIHLHNIFVLNQLKYSTMPKVPLVPLKSRLELKKEKIEYVGVDK